MLKSSPAKALMYLSAAASMALACAACAGGPRPVTILGAVRCGALVPDSLRRDVAAPALPSADTAGDWIAYADAATGKLDEANANKTAVVEIVDACDRQHDALREALKPESFWSRLWPG